MRYVVYLLFSDLHNRTYVGQSEDLASRIAKHNKGEVRSTKTYRPWRVVHYESYLTRGEAMNRERWFKSPAGRRFIKELLQTQRA